MNRVWRSPWFAGLLGGAGVAGSAVLTTLLWNTQRGILGDVRTDSWNSLVTTTSIVITAVATTAYLFATLSLLRETQDSNALVRNMTMKLHADAATACPALEGLSCTTRIGVKNYDVLVVRQITETPDGIRVNDQVTVGASEFYLEAKVELQVANLAQAGTELRGSLEMGTLGPHQFEILLPGSSCRNVHLEAKHSIPVEDIHAYLGNALLLRVKLVSSEGELAAQDTSEYVSQFGIGMAPSIPRPLSRTRIYPAQEALGLTRKAAS